MSKSLLNAVSVCLRLSMSVYAELIAREFRDIGERLASDTRQPTGVMDVAHHREQWNIIFERVVLKHRDRWVLI